MTSVLSDGTIRRLVEEGRILIEPWDPEMLQPASIDLRLGRSFRVFESHKIPAIDLADPPRNVTELVEIGGDESFVIHPGEFVLGRTEERVELADDLVARIEGKALALDTDVPTPLGWRTMADLRPGDLVFDLEGSLTVVVAATEAMAGRPCAEVRFSDGTTVVADLDHGWLTETKQDRRRGEGPKVRTTEEIARTLRYSPAEYNHTVDQALPVRYPRQDLSIDPYVLGTVDEALAAEYRELVASRGLKPVVATKTATLGGRVCGLRHEVTFTADVPVFRLPRKPARQKREGRFKRGRSIVAVTPVASRPVRCIQIADPRGVFLITRSFVPTHNSSLGRLGLIVHATAGFVDPGFRGTLTLEITNLTRVPIVLRPGKPIAQLSFMALDRPAERPYGHPDLGSHYFGQVDATESRYGGPAAGRGERRG
jgi:deoxycytidine triphosphate deaminase